MARKRPTLLTVMGILNIVIGGLFLVCNLCGGLVLLILLGGNLQGAFGDAVKPFSDMWDFMKVEVPGYAVMTIGDLVLNMVLLVILIVAGIGLLNMKPWGRMLSIAYSILTILEKLGSLIFALALVNPAQARWALDYQRRHPGFEANVGNPLENVGAVIGVVIGMAYAIVLLIMMLLPSVSAAFAARGRPDDYDLDRPEDEDDLGRERWRPDDANG